MRSDFSVWSGCRAFSALQVSVETMTYVVGPEGMAIKVQTCDLGAEGAVSAIVRTDRS